MRLSSPQSLSRRSWAWRYLAVSAVIAVATSSLCWLWGSSAIAWSWALGCLVQWLPTALLAARYFSLAGARQARNIYRRLWQGEILKWASTACLIYGMITASSVDLKVVLAAFLVHNFLVLLAIPAVDRWDQAREL